MLVKPTTTYKLDDYIGDMASANLCDLYPMEFVLSDDIWNKFELPHGDGITDSPFSEFEMDPTISSLLSYTELCEIRNHDCMWAGHCGSKEHPADEHKLTSWPPIKHQTPVNVKQPPSSSSIPAGRSLLLKAQHPQPPQTTPAVIANAVLPNLDSPPNSDDEDVKAKTETLKLLQDAISECDLEDDSDLYDYFEDEELLKAEAVDENQTTTTTPQQQNTTKPTTQANFATSDHCYHKDKNASMRMNNLGLETPSDSEEEIDVVSVGDKTTNSSRMVCALPNNPSSRDKQQLQRTMASAINKNGIKTLLPRKSSTAESSPGKRRMVESRGIKRTKHRSPPVSPYKKRASYNHSSDSEPEPSEKRNLHNNMERQRRIDLRNAFEDLRTLVPEVSKRERAPKVVILREASVYCHRLGDVSHSMLRQVDELRRQQKRLRARVSQLRLSLAAKHR